MFRYFIKHKSTNLFLESHIVGEAGAGLPVIGEIGRFRRKTVLQSSTNNWNPN